MTLGAGKIRRLTREPQFSHLVALIYGHIQSTYEPIATGWSHRPNHCYFNFLAKCCIKYKIHHARFLSETAKEK